MVRYVTSLDLSTCRARLLETTERHNPFITFSLCDSPEIIGEQRGKYFWLRVNHNGNSFFTPWFAGEFKSGGTSTKIDGTFGKHGLASLTVKTHFYFALILLVLSLPFAAFHVCFLIPALIVMLNV